MWGRGEGKKKGFDFVCFYGKTTKRALQKKKKRKSNMQIYHGFSSF